MATSVLLNVGVNQTYLLNSLNRAFAKAESDFRGLNLKLNDRAFSQPLGRITGDVNQFTKSLEAATARVVSFSATLGIIGAAGRAFKEIVNSTIEVEKRLKEINSVFGLSSSGLTKFNREIFDAARNTGQSFEVASKAALEFSRQGLSVEETLKRVNSALVLSRLSGLDANEAVSTITTTLNGFNKEALTAVDVVNKLASVDSKFAVSTKDLSEALQRVGSTAQDAGVGFDKLLGVITSAKQITGREGAVIGNAIKSIFTRIQRTDVVDQLENLGIAVRDVSNNIRPADQVLQSLAKQFDNLTASQQQYVAELSGGLFQINQLRALLNDLGRSYNIVDQATKVSAVSQNEAIKRNEALNQSLSTLLTNAQTTGKEIAAAFGNIAINDPLKKLFPKEGSAFGNFKDSIVGGLKKIGDDKAEFENTGEKISKTIGEGLAKGLANILSGPGLVTAAFLGAKLVALTSQKVSGALQSLGSNDRQASTLKGVEVALNRANQAELRRVDAATTLAEKEAAILAILERQQAIIAGSAGSRLQQIQAIQTNKTAVTIAKKFGTAAEGYIPDYVNAERSSIARGVGGASASAKPVIIPNFNYGGGQRGTIVANTDEYMVPNFARGGSAIFNKKMIASMGLPEGALKIAAGGYVPNFTNLGDEAIKRLLATKQFKSFEYINAKGETSTFYNAQHGVRKDLIKGAPAPAGYKNWTEFFNLNGNINLRAKKMGEDEAGFRTFKLSRIKSITAGGKTYSLADGYIPNFAVGPIGLRAGATPVGQGAYGAYMKTKDPRFGFKRFKTDYGNPEQYIREEYAISKLASEMGLPVAKAFGSAARSVKRGGIYKENIEGTLGSKLSDSLKTEAVMELRAMFRERGIDPVDLSPRRADNFMVRKGADLKDIRSILKNSVVVDPGQFQVTDESLLKNYYKYYRSKAGGYIPNFADDALAKAINRESEAVNLSKVYVDQDPRLKSAINPNGLLVANRRDEPNGGFEGVNRVLAQGGNPKAAGLASGYIPNFAFSEKSGLRTNINNAGFEGYGMLVPPNAIKDLNNMFKALKGAKDLIGLDKVGDNILAFAKNLDKVSKLKVESKLGEAYPKIKKAIDDMAFSANIFNNNANKSGQKGGGLNEPNFAAFNALEQSSSPSSNIGFKATIANYNKTLFKGIPPTGTGIGGVIGGSGSNLLKETDVEKTFNRNLYNIPNKILEAISKNTGSPLPFNRQNKPFIIDDMRDLINSSRGRKFDVGGKDIGNIIDISRAKTFKSEFVQDVQDEISRSGKSLAEAMQIAAKNFLDTGGSQANLRRTILSTTRGLDEYETNIRRNQQQAESNRRITAAIKTIESGGTLTPSGTTIGRGGASYKSVNKNYDALLQANALETEGRFLQSVGKGSVRELSEKEAKVLARAQSLTRGTLVESLKKPQDLASLYKELQTSKRPPAPIFGLDKVFSAFDNLTADFSKRAEDLIKSRKLNPEIAERVRGQASQLTSQRQGKLERLAFTAPFIASVGAGFIPEGEGGTRAGKIGGATSGFLQGAATGASIGGIFGLQGAAIGAAAGGAVGGFTGFIGKASKSFEELSKIIGEINSKYTEQVNSASNYIQLQQQLNDAIASGASDAQLSRISKQQVGTIRGLPSEDRKSLIAAGNDIEKLSEAISNITKRAESAFRKNDSLSAVFSAGKSGSIFSGVSAKDATSAVDAFAVAIDLSDEKTKKGFEKFKETLGKEDVSKSFTNLATTLGYSSKEISDVLGEYKYFPSELLNILNRVVDVKNKEVKEEGDYANKRRNVALINAETSRSLSKLSIATSFQSEIGYGREQSQLRIKEKGLSAGLEISNISALEKIQQDTANQLTLIQDRGNSELRKNLLDSFSNLQSILAQSGDKVLPQKQLELLKVFKSNSPEELKKFLENNGKIFEGVKKELERAVLEQEKIADNTKNQLTETRAFGKISEVLSKFQIRNEILTKGQFSQERIDTSVSLFRESRVGNKASRNPEGERIQSLLKEIEDQNSLYIEDTYTNAVKQALMQRSGNVTMANVLSEALGKAIDSSEEQLFKAAQEALSSQDTGVQNIGRRTIDTLNARKFDLGAARKGLAEISPESIQQFTQKGGTGLELTITTIDKGNKILSQIEENTRPSVKPEGSKIIDDLIGTSEKNAKLAQANKVVEDLQAKKQNIEKQLSTTTVTDNKKSLLNLGFTEANKNFSNTPFATNGASPYIAGNNITESEFFNKLAAEGIFREANQRNLSGSRLLGSEGEDIFKTYTDKNKLDPNQFRNWFEETLKNIGKSNLSPLAQQKYEKSQGLSSEASTVNFQLAKAKADLEGMRFANSMEAFKINPSPNLSFSSQLNPTEKGAISTNSTGLLGNVGTFQNIQPFSIDTSPAKKGITKTIAQTTGEVPVSIENATSEADKAQTDVARMIAGMGRKEITTKQQRLGNLTIELTTEENNLKNLRQSGATQSDILDQELKIKKIKIEQERVNNGTKDIEADISAAQEEYKTLLEKRNKGIAVSGDQLEAAAMKDAKLQGIAGESGKSLVGGFQARFKGLKADIQDLSQLGASLASTLENNLGNAWGNFVTGAKSGKDAFREFAVSITADASRAFGNKAMQGLLGMAFGNAGGSVTPQGINPMKFASGGSVPSMIMGGEYYISPSAAQRIGKPLLNQINAGVLPSIKNYASGGLVRGGSGVRDDIPTNLPANSYIIKKSAVNKYGTEYLDSLAQGRVQKKFFGGLLLGGLLGAGIGYATGGKKGAIKGALIGGVLGGFAQNYAQSGNLLKSGTSGQGMFSFAANSTSSGVPAMLAKTGPAFATQIPTYGAAAAGSSAGFGPLGMMAASAGLGIISSLLTGKSGSTTGKPMTAAEISANRLVLESQQNEELSKATKPAILQLNPQGGYSLTGFGEASTRRFAGGGEVSMIDMGQGANLSPLARYANGGEVLPSVNQNGDTNSSGANVEINITINEGESSSTTKKKGDGDDGFGERLGKAVEQKVIEVLTKEGRVGGMLTDQKRR